jgi:hypothetical protein
MLSMHYRSAGNQGNAVPPFVNLMSRVQHLIYSYALD